MTRYASICRVSYIVQVVLWSRDTAFFNSYVSILVSILNGSHVSITWVSSKCPFILITWMLLSILSDHVMEYYIKWVSQIESWLQDTCTYIVHAQSGRACLNKLCNKILITWSLFKCVLVQSIEFHSFQASCNYWQTVPTHLYILMYV